MLHKKIQLGDIHKLHNWEFPTAVQRLAQTVSAEDIGKISWQKDDDSFWLLKNNSPLEWIPFSTNSVGITTASSAGVVVLPSFTDNLDGSVTIGAGSYALYDNVNYQGVAAVYEIAETTLALTDNSVNYILADYNSGLPQLTVVTSVPPTNTTDSNRIPVFSTYRAGTDIHHFDWDHLSRGLAEKINQRLRRTDRFHIDNGISLSETPTRVINISGGQIWAGANIISLDSITSASPETHFYYHTAGTWTRGNLSQYNNQQYDDGTNLVTLSNGKYAVNWVYRSVQPEGAIYVLLGNGNYSLIEAQASVEPSKPTEISTQAVLVGRIIVAKGLNTATQIDKVSTVTFGASAVVNHNDLSGIQGGATEQYWHLNTAEYSRVQVLNSGAMKASTRLVTTSGSISLTDSTIRADATAGAITLTLPQASTCTGYIYRIKKINANSNAVTLDGFNSETIDGSLQAVINITNQSLAIQSNGTSWDII